MKDYSLISPEKVSLSLNLAGVGSRFAARFIDCIFQGLLLGLFIFGLSLLNRSGIIVLKPKNPSALWATVIIFTVIIPVLTILYGYFILFETMWNGQTPGKRFIRLRVVQDNGSSVTFSKVLIRNLMRIIDALPSFYAVGIISALINKKNQRLGDMAAGTIVIREYTEKVPAVLNIEAVETAWSGAARLRLHEIGEADFAVLKKYLLRRENLDKGEAEAMDEKLSLYFSQRLGLEPEETGNHLEFIKQLFAAFQSR